MTTQGWISAALIVLAIWIALNVYCLCLLIRIYNIRKELEDLRNKRGRFDITD